MEVLPSYNVWQCVYKVDGLDYPWIIEPKHAYFVMNRIISEITENETDMSQYSLVRVHFLYKDETVITTVRERNDDGTFTYRTEV